MLKALRHRIKEFCLGTKHPTMRWALDEFLKRRVSGRIALADHSRVHAAIREPLQRELVKVLGFSSEFETELYVRRFETDFARICDRRYAVGTHSGTSALQLSLAAHGIGPGDEVITVPFTYIATALAISNTGARPVFVDIDHATFNMDPCLIEAAITPRTKAIVPVHLYGQIANMIEITRIAEAHGLKVVEDACQAFGAELHGRKAGTLGDAGCFSFSTPKNLSGFGNGGMVVSNNRSLIEEIRALRNPESNTPSILHSHRTPCYLDAIQIAFLRAKFPLVREWIAQRRANVELYRSSLGDLDLELPVESQGARHTYYRFAVRTKRRNQLRHWLNQRGIRAVNPYSPCLHLTRTYAELGHSRGAFPNSEAAEREALLLPVSNFITDEERTKILHDVQGFFAMSS